MENILKFIVIILFIFLVVAFAGFLNIWALNTLFPALNIPYNIWTWLASIILFANIVNFNRSKE